MIIIGAKGFAKELLQVIDDNHELTDSLCFFDDINQDMPELLYGKFKLLHSFNELKNYFNQYSPEFVLGIGNPLSRQNLCNKAINAGGKLSSIISRTSFISKFGVILGNGLCVMQNVIIENDAQIGEGCLVHTASMVSHDVHIGCFSEISPGVKLLGRVIVGDRCSIGTNAVILPSIKIGSNVKVGAGAVVTKDLRDNITVVGIPAREIEVKH